MGDNNLNSNYDAVIGRLPENDSFQALVNQKSNAELAKRTAASYTIMLLYGIFVNLTPLLKEHGAIVLIIGGTIASSLVTRGLISKKVPASDRTADRTAQSAWLRKYALATLWVAASWAGFQYAIYYLYGITWILYLSTIITVGIVATSTTTLAPSANLARAYSFLVVSPLIIVGLLERTLPSITMSVMLVFYLVAVMIMIKSNHNLYRSSLITIEILNFQKADLENIISRVVDNGSKLKDASTNLSDISEEMSDSAENMSIKSNSASRSVNDLKANSKNTSDAMIQLRENADRLAALTGEMTNSINVISHNTEKTDTIAQEAVNQAQNVTENVNLLGESARQVGNISETIEEISSQTNLLALNATIEAARAGDAGKGFAVVANEIKTLASQTAEATQQIKNQINAIQSAISDTVSEIGRISSITMEIGESTAISASSVKEQAIMANTISAGVSNASEAVTTISTHADRTLATTDQIAENISIVADAVTDVVGHSMNVEKSAKSLMEQANGLNELIETFRNR